MTALMTNQEKYQAGEVSGIRVIFPTTKEAMREARKAIDVDGIRCREVFLTEHDSNLRGFSRCITLGDPVEVTVRGYELSIRKADAEMIEIG